MSSQFYIVQIRFRNGGYAEGVNIIAKSDDEATEKGQAYANERKQLGQDVDGFRVLKATYESARLVHEST